jgi:hypothetical protein
MVNSEQMLVVIRNARKEGRLWSEVAWALVELEQGGPVDDNGRPWIQRAEAESGYSANQLRRMVKVAQFRNHLIRTEAVLAGKLLAKPFSHIEVIAKIWKLDEGEARRLIEDENSNDTFRSLLEIYGRASEHRGGAAPVVAGKKAAKDFREKAFTLLRRDQENLFERDAALDFEIMRPIVPFRYASPDFYIVGRENGKVTRIDAIDCYALYDGSQKDIALRKMISVATESTFFSRFWIVVPAGASADIVLWERRDLHLDNVGVVVVEKERLYWERIPPARAKPNPDRRHLWTDYDKSRLRRAGPR